MVFLTSLGCAKIIKLEDQLEGVQIMYHWTGILTLITIVVGLIGGMFGFLAWLQGRKKSRGVQAVEEVEHVENLGQGLDFEDFDDGNRNSVSVFETCTCLYGINFQYSTTYVILGISAADFNT